MGHRNNFGLHNWASGAQTYFKRAYRAHLFANQPTIHPTQKPTKHSNHQSAQTQQIKPATHPPSKTSQPTSTPEPSRSTNKETEEIMSCRSTAQPPQKTIEKKNTRGRHAYNIAHQTKGLLRTNVAKFQQL
ncbi:hypothetical protein MANES_04G165501v8 [Manihot esculenta]|uniref:Uncharacterized protein n=1 Tax=Manihot esculenta TaxID=3983 RepID=A0ACB7HVN3_MANES|nr:hypothetical protein MANES_04G165501v8 [Manihot esculenta]